MSPWCFQKPPRHAWARMLLLNVTSIAWQCCRIESEINIETKTWLFATSFADEFSVQTPVALQSHDLRLYLQILFLMLFYI